MKNTKHTASVASHTPGPWNVYRFDGKHGPILSIYAKEVDDVIHWAGFDSARNNHNHEQCIANAAIIAAAPELLTELKQAKAALQAVTGSDFAAYCAKLDKLIAKATGHA